MTTTFTPGPMTDEQRIQFDMLATIALAAGCGPIDTEAEFWAAMTKLQNKLDRAERIIFAEKLLTTTEG